MFNKCNNSSGAIYRTKNILLCLVLLTVFLRISFNVVFSEEEEKKKQEKKQEQIIIPNPSAFIEENLGKSYENLKKLKENYEECCGSLFLFELDKKVDPKEISKSLPQPKTLRFHITYPEEKKIDLSISEETLKTLNKWKSSDLFFTGGRDDEWIDTKYYTGDPETSALLNLKNRVAKLMAVSFSFPTDEIYKVDGLGRFTDVSRVHGIPEKDSAQMRLSSPVQLCKNISVSNRKWEKQCVKLYYEKCCSNTKTYELTAAILDKDGKLIWDEKQEKYLYVVIGYDTNCVDDIGIQKLSGGSGHIFSFPEDLQGKFNVQISDGISITKEGEIAFTSPGVKTITISGKTGVERATPVSCAEQGKHSTSSSVMSSWKQSDKTFTNTYKFTSLKFIKFGIPGIDFEEEGVKKPYLDYFISAKQKDVYSSSATVPAVYREVEKKPYVLEINADPMYDLTLIPKVLVDTGEQGEKSFEISYFPVSVRTIVKEPGPILSGGEGRLSYAGGIGSSVIAWQLGKLETEQRTVKHRFTVNLVEVQIDPEMRDKVLSQGGSYKVKLLVLGDADMVRNYSVAWETQGLAKWEESATLFRKSGNLWVAENTLIADVSEKWQDAIGKEIKFSASVNYSPSQKVFSFRGTCKLTIPVVENLKLLVEYSNEKPQEIDEIDLFYPNTRGYGVRLIPHVTLKGVKEEEWTFRDIKSSVQMEFRSSNPYAAMITEGGRIISSATYPLETKITAKINGYSNINSPEGPRTLEIEGDKIISNSIWVHLNRLMLTSSPGKEDKKIYKLAVSGAGDISKYNAVWKMDNTIFTTQFEKEGDAYVTSLSTSLKMKNVQIVKGKIIIAELGGKDISLHSVVRLLPTNPPATTVKRTTGPDMGELEKMEAMDECVENVTFWVKYLGFEAGTTPENYCKQEIKQKEQEMKQEREEIEAQNKFVKELEKKGLELIVFSDNMKVGAVITGLLREYWDRTSCRWSIKSDSKLILDKDMTPVEMSSEGLGGCFNIVKGIQKNFDPNAVLKVELAIDTEASSLPLFIESGKYVGIPASEF